MSELTRRLVAISESAGGYRHKEDSVHTAIAEAIDAGRFALTSVLIAPTDVRTLGLQSLNGVRTQNESAYGRQPFADPSRALGERVGPITLIHRFAPGERVDATGRTIKTGIIYVDVMETYRVPGSRFSQTRKVRKDRGNHATVSLREAINVLVRFGWPVRDAHSRGNSEGEIIELAWLVAEAADPDAEDSVREMMESIRPRAAELLAQATAPVAPRAQPPAKTQEARR